jgi:hypothetical protein
MKSGNYVVACVATGIGTAPFYAYRCHPKGFLATVSMENWFVSALRGGEEAKLLLIIAAIGGIFGLTVGLLLKWAMPSSDRELFDPPLLRTPGAATVLVPMGLATIMLVIGNYTAGTLERLVWPDFYAKYWFGWSAIAAFSGYVLVKLLNTWERAFPLANFLIRFEIVCCSPLTVCVSSIIVAGVVGTGLLGGFVVGRFCGCPMTAAWTGTSIGVIVLAIEGGVFWPAYYFLAEPQGNK